MAKVDLKQTLKHLYRPTAEAVAVVDVPALPFLMIDGSGDPNTAPEYVAALEALYAVAYGLKFQLKQAGGAAPDYVVMPLEGLWWADDMRLFSAADKAAWRWTMMILQPDAVTSDLFAEVVQAVERKKRPAALPKLRLDVYQEGPAVQIMYRGPYSAEAPTIARLHAFIERHGYTLRGKHHEIYLGDPRRTAPDKLLTIIRQPFDVPDHADEPPVSSAGLLPLHA